jgi:cholest-4-en-3-one 26-monooxygenase
MDDLEAASNLHDPRFYLSEGFRPLLDRLRRDSPVHWTQAWPDRGFWSVTRHCDCRDVLLQPILFSSQAMGDNIPADPHMYDDPAARAAAGMGFVPGFMDPPRHDAVRRPFVKPFAAAAVARMAGQTQAICDRLVDEIVDRGECEFAREIAARLPSQLVCGLLGVPCEDWDHVGQYVNSFICYTEPAYQLGATPAETIAIAARGQFDYVRALVADRRANPRDDLTTLAAFAPITEEECLWWCWAILIAGVETTRNVITGGLLALIEHPEEMNRLRTHPDGAREAAEELARWTTPVPAVLRVATEDTAIAGQPIGKGDWVVAWLVSANRDESVFADPLRFDLSRSPNPHLAFGYGTHLCLGRNIALLEIRQIIQTVLRRLDRIELAGPVEWTSSVMATGVKSLPIRFRAAQDP